MIAKDDPLRERILLLEETAAHQGRAIEELSAQLAAQWKIVDRLQSSLDRLSERFHALEDATLDAPAITKPPHY